MVIPDVLRAVFIGMFPLLFITLTAAVLTKLGHLGKHANPNIATMIANFFNPIFCLLIIWHRVDFYSINSTWPLLTFPILLKSIILVISYFFTRLIKLPLGLANTFTAFMAMPYISLAFPMMQSLCHQASPFSHFEGCSSYEDYIAYVWIPENFMMWTICYALIEYDKHLVAKANNDPSTKLLNDIPATKISFYSLFKQALFKPNPVCIIIGSLLSLMPGMKDFVFNKSSDFYCFADAGLWMSKIGLIFCQFLLGSNIYTIRGLRSKLELRQIIIITFAKTVVVPLLCLLGILGISSFGAFGNNIIMAYALFVCLSGPTSIFTMMYAALLKHAMHEVLECMFWVYLFSFITLILWTAIFFQSF